MRVRIVVADQGEARFYDIARPDAVLQPAGRLTDPRPTCTTATSNRTGPGECSIMPRPQPVAAAPSRTMEPGASAGLANTRQSLRAPDR